MTASSFSEASSLALATLFTCSCKPGTPLIKSDGYSFQVEMNYRAAQRGLKITEVPIHFEERVEGASKMNLREQLESALTPWKLRLKRDSPVLVPKG